MHSPNPAILTRLRFTLLVLFIFFLLHSVLALQAEAKAGPQLASDDEIDFPEQLGEIVYQTQTAAASRIYIIANGHRSAINGANAVKTLQAQVETFRIGEWLINQNRIEMLLPEGFFGEMGSTSAIDANKNLFDGQRLQDALADTSHFVNAELLLHKNYGIGLEQVENRKLYHDVRDRLSSSLKPGAKILLLNRELTYLQKLRTASMLQSAPAVIETAYQQGRIAAPNAMLTIGLSHLEDIISFLEAGEIGMTGLHTTSIAFPPQNTELELLKKQVGVTVIVPRILISHGFEVKKRT
ncbi:MAG: hypothetical protein BA863_15870 [Desulfovibrio sp. S3730MH75]|nr:MAG: hypothetical protein BA863_15870 [Desulfovibrio sp. S3730MH75]